MEIPSRTVSQLQLERCIDALASDYQDLQFPACGQLDAPPSALEALRMISKGHPVVIKGFSPILAQRDWCAPETYTAIHSDDVTIAVTDDGLADSVRTLPDRTTTFVKPCEERMPMADFLHKLTTRQADAEPQTSGTSASGNSSGASDVLYLQSQDGNIFRSEPGARGAPELAAFQAVVARDVDWMKEAIGTSADAVNLWIGTAKSTTSFHHDPYENIYHVLSGSKTFTLVSPIDGVQFEQRFHPPSTLTRQPDGSLIPVPDEGAHHVPWVAELDVEARHNPVVAHLEEGDTLFLPAGWWHMVDQAEGTGGLAVAVNYWYTSELNPQRYAYERFVSRIARLAGREVVPVDNEDSDSDSPGADVWGSEGDVTSSDEWDPRDWGR